MSRHFFLLPILIFFLSPSLNAQQRTGILSGTVTDSDTRQGLPGVHVSIPELETGTVSNDHGEFRFENIPAGVYSVQFSFIGFQGRLLTNVVVRSNRTETVETSLRQRIIEGNQVTVSSGYFYKDDMHPLSRVDMGAEEIRRSPGSGQELSRVMSAVAGVASLGDLSQDLIVRGGSPGENGFYIDNIYLPGVRHFETVEGASHGPTGLINTSLVQSLEFSTGGFSASRGGHMSSVADIRYRNGNREQVHGSLDMTMAGLGGMVETPIAGGKGSLLVSARRSYLDLLADALNARGAPRYGDIQAKATYNPDRNNRLVFLQIFGDSRITTSLEEARDEGWPTYPHMHNRQNTSGLNWRKIWTGSLHSNTSLSYSFKEQNSRMFHSDQGDREQRFDNRQDYAVMRHISYWSLSDRHRVEWGSDIIFTKGGFDYHYAPVVNEANAERPDVYRQLQKRQVTGELFGTYVFRTGRDITVSAGGRIGYNSVNENWALSPRVGTTWAVTDRLNLNLAGGIYRQPLPLFLRSQQPGFDTLKDPFTTHFITGADYLLGEATKVSLEIYDKQYRNLPIQPEGFSEGAPSYVYDSRNIHEELLDHGTGYARGIDLIVQRKIKEGLYGTVSASFFRSRYRDYNGSLQSRDYDVDHLFNMIVGYRPNDYWEFSARWSYIGNRPYTPLDITASAEHNRTILDISRYNSGTMDAFHSLYLRFDRRFFLDHITVGTFFELWNAYNRSNMHSVHWNLNSQAPAKTRQFDLLPVGGFAIEF
ncbi:MAG: TonB-dependent receptor [Balneolaceae bacterium]